jgi:hypothetical protein
MSSVEHDESREHRIEMEIIVDAYTEEEQAMGWYYYLDDKLNFPFKAQWINRKGQSEEVEVQEMSSEDDCGKDMFVEVLYREGEAEDVFSVSLYEIEAIDADPKTQEAIADWHYWVERGNKL